MFVPFKQIPTFDCATETWTYTDFSSQEAFAEFLDDKWSDECDYKFDEDSLWFNEKGRFFDEHGYYTDLPRKSRERKEFWTLEGEKSVRGVIVKGKKTEWYLTRDYYFVLNYGRIANKEKDNKDTFPDVRDIQYHLSLYEKRAEVHHRHAILTKKRQMMSSLLHCAKVINKYWFDKNSVCKIFASDASFINIEKGIWKFFNKYRDFLNEHTDWYRPNLPDEEFAWQQRWEVKVNGRKMYKGRMSTLSGHSLKTSPFNGVGGATSYGYHEEAGIAPKLNTTYGAFRPATESGIHTTGMFIAAGSVGDLKDCIPLKDYMYAPTSNRFLAVNSTWVTKDRVPTLVGCYIPEHWGMPGYIDEYGNSKIEEAYEYLKKFHAQIKDDPKVSRSDYQLEISQHPIFLDDAFKHRDVSYFPVDLMENQQARIELKTREDRWEYKPQKGLLRENVRGEVELYTPMPWPPEHQYPIKKEWPDKRGLVTIYEPPDKGAKFFTYFAGIDSVEADETTTSDSVFSIDIFKTVVEVEYEEKGKIKKRIEGDKVVATYRGRFNTTEATNHQGWLLMKMYNAFGLAERSKPNFINYLQRLGKAELHLAKESHIPIFKDMNYNNMDAKTKFGFVISPHNEMGKLLKTYLREYLLAEYGTVEGADGQIIRTLKGVDRMDDYWSLEELIQYNDKSGNYDRFISLAAAVLIAKVHQNNGAIIRRSEVQEKNPVQIIKRPISMIGGGIRPTIPRKGQKPRSLL
jgi:hypothetical protein